MKITQTYTTLAALAAMAAGITSAYADTLKVSHNPTSASESLDLTDASIYESAPSEIKSTDDIEFTHNTTVNGQYVSRISKDFTINNITYNSKITGYIWSETLLSIGKDVKANINSLTINMDSDDGLAGNSGTGIRLDDKSVLNIANGIKYTDNRQKLNWSEIRLTFDNSPFGTVNIGGDIEMFDNTNLSAEGRGGAGTSLDFKGPRNVTVGGVIKMSTKSYKKIALDVPDWGAGKDGYDFNRSLGGIEIDSNGRIELNGTTAATTTHLTFTNSGKNEFVGTLITRQAGNVTKENNKTAVINSLGEVTNNKLNITMNATDAKKGNQILRFGEFNEFLFDTNASATGTYDVYGIAQANNSVATVTVVSGRLDLGMASAMKGEKLVMASSSSTANAVFSATGTAAGSEIGKVTFGSFQGSNGTIVFDFAKNESDFIKVEGAATAADLTFFINMTKSEFDSYLESATELNYDIMSFQTEDSSFNTPTLSFADSQLTGALSLNADDSTGITTVKLTITTAAVPEPATVAAILGAIAFAFAAYRRRK